MVFSSPKPTCLCVQCCGSDLGAKIFEIRICVACCFESQNPWVNLPACIYFHGRPHCWKKLNETTYQAALNHMYMVNGYIHLTVIIGIARHEIVLALTKTRPVRKWCAFQGVHALFKENVCLAHRLATRQPGEKLHNYPQEKSEKIRWTLILRFNRNVT